MFYERLLVWLLAAAESQLLSRRIQPRTTGNLLSRTVRLLAPSMRGEFFLRFSGAEGKSRKQQAVL